MKNRLLIFQHLSMDVALGACFNAWLVTHILQISLPVTVYFGLFLSVWVIYTFDHLQDTLTLKSESPRHQFHKRNYSLLRVIMWIGVSALFVMAFWIPISLVVAVGLFGIGPLAYFVLLRLPYRYPRVFKESLAAILYAGGICLAPFMLAPYLPVQVGLFTFSFYFLLAFSNLLLFAGADAGYDRMDSQPNLVNSFGNQPIRTILWMVFSLLAVILGLQFFMADFGMGPLCIFGFMWAVHLALFIFQRWFTLWGLFRITGDGIFLAPAILWGLS